MPRTSFSPDQGFVDLDFAKVDTDRRRRQGFPEVIFCQGKTPDQVASIFQVLAKQEPMVLATRATPEQTSAILSVVPESTSDPLARCCWLGQAPSPPAGRVLVMGAGTSDLPVVREAAITASLCGGEVTECLDVGVAGLHRLLAQQELMSSADVLIVVAGMEGALPSVVTGLVSCPVIAVPTSIGYGSHGGGMVPLLAMLNSCASGLTVVNIDNGFGAGFAAGRILTSLKSFKKK